MIPFLTSAEARNELCAFTVIDPECYTHMIHEIGRLLMLLEAYPDGFPRIEEAAGYYVCWCMQDGDYIVTCRILADLLDELFGEPDSVALDLFLSHRSAIEDAARERYGAMGAPNGRLALEQIDIV